MTVGSNHHRKAGGLSLMPYWESFFSQQIFGRICQHQTLPLLPSILCQGSCLPGHLHYPASSLGITCSRYVLYSLSLFSFEGIYCNVHGHCCNQACLIVNLLLIVLPGGSLYILQKKELVK